jgi:hypothetical protein
LIAESRAMRADMQLAITIAQGLVGHRLQRAERVGRRENPEA